MISFGNLVVIMYVIQVLHSLEELKYNFPGRWFYRKLSYRFFIPFEITHNLFWGGVVFLQNFPYRKELLGVFVVLMFANGIEHIVWYMWEKKYVPGLFTATIHVFSFTLFVLLAVGSWI